jgi:hypothetical protein
MKKMINFVSCVPLLPVNTNQAVAGPLSRHSVQTSAQAQSEMIMFQRRLDRMLLQTPGRVNLAHSLASPRLFNLLLVALPANPAIEDLQLANNNLDDGCAHLFAPSPPVTVRRKRPKSSAFVIFLIIKYIA